MKTPQLICYLLAWVLVAFSLSARGQSDDVMYAVTKGWMEAVSPRLAVINCGQWNWGKNDDSTSVKFTTYAYGHPNKRAIDLLEKNISEFRPQPLRVMIGIKGQDPGDPLKYPVFKDAIIAKNIYATAWNGNINIRATADRQYSVISDR